MEGDAEMEKEWIYAGQETFTYGSEDESTTPGRIRLTPKVPDDYDATEVIFIVDDFRTTASKVSSGTLHWNGNSGISIGNSFDSVVGDAWFGRRYYYYKKLFDGMWAKQGAENGLTEPSMNDPKYLSGHWVSLDAGNILTVTGRTYYR